MKKLFIYILAFIMLPIFNFSASAEDINYYTSFDSIQIKGYAEPTTGNPFVTILLKDGSKIIGLGETKIDSSGRYEYIFKAPKLTEETKLIVKCADKDITNTVYEAILKASAFVEIPYQLIENETAYSINADLTEVTKFTDSYTIILAQYDENGKLVECSAFKSEDLEDKSFFNKSIDKTGNLKLFAWSSFEQMVPIGNFSEGDGGLLLKFGAKADNQQREGYKTITGENGYERYLQVKSELPEELNVIAEQNPDIKNVFYVSPTQSDNGDGSYENPFSSIELAISAYGALTEFDKESWTAIYLLGGDYEITDTITVDNQITNPNRKAKLFIGAYNDEKVTFSTTKTVTGDMLIPVSDENTDSSVIERIHKDAGQIYYVDYKTLGIKKMNDGAYGTSGRKPKLLLNDELQILSRYPNSGDTYISNVISNGYDSQYLDYAVFVPTDNKPFSWTNQSEIGIAGQLSVNWYYNHMQALFDNEQNYVKVPTSQATAQGNGIATKLINRPEDKAHFHYYNVFEEMDMQGEWCYSDEEQRLYIYPNGDVTSAKLTIAGDMIDYAIRINGVSDVVIDGINLELFKNGIRIENSERVVVQNCEFNNTVESMSIYESKSSGVLSSDFNNVYTGVSITGISGNVGNLEPKRNFIQNCHFNNVENDCTDINYSSGNIISHNLAENFKGWFSAVFYGSENIIEYNEAYAGGFNGNEDYIIYIDGHYDARANHVRYNYLHDFSPDASKIITGLVICLDDLSEEQYVYGNVIKNAHGGIFGNGGDNNVIDGNYIIDCNSTNTWCSIEMGNSMYGKNVNVIGSAFLNDLESTRHMSTYYRQNLETTKWGQRYPHVVTRAEYLEDISKVWNTGDKTSEDMIFARLCTGNYITNNVGINAEQFAINAEPLTDDMDGDGNSDVTNVSQMYKQMTNPADGVSQDEYGNDYNVVWNNSYLDNIDLTELDVVSKAGLKREPVYRNDTGIEITYSARTNTYLINNVLDLCWNKPDKANFYKLIVSSDENFNNIISENWFLENRGTVTFRNYSSKPTIYCKILAYNAGIGESSLSSPIAQSNICRID